MALCQRTESDPVELAYDDNHGRAVGELADHVLQILDGDVRSATWQLCISLFIRGKYDFTSQFIYWKYK